MSLKMGKGEMEHRKATNEKMEKYEVRDCLKQSLDFNFNNVFPPSNNSLGESESPYIGRIIHKEENVG